MNLNYTFSDKAKRSTFILMGIGILAFIYGLVSKDVSGIRIWANLLIEGFFFTAIALGAIFFMALQYVAQTGWSVAVKRVYEAIGTYLPIGAIVILIVIIGSVIGGMSGSSNIIYHWMQKGIDNPASPHFDKLLAFKHPYLNIPFFIIRTCIYFGLWIYMARMLRKRSLESDLTDDYLHLHYKNVTTSGIFVVVFGLTSSMAAWDWLMSIDGHWLSTLYGWYVFSGMWVTAMIVIIMITAYLKGKGYLENVNENHFHDLGKWMFATSVLWGYLWFAQFLLYWYANIPDEVVYYQVRIDHYRVILWIMFLVNLFLPLVILMSRDAKRNTKFLIAIGCVIFISHWLDVCLLVVPGTVGLGWHIGIVEIGMFLGFLGLFTFVVMRSLSKAPIQVKNHPYLEESVHHHI